MNTWLARACVTAGTLTTVGLLTAGIASAHLAVDSPDPVQGGNTVVTFRVPTESAALTTTGLTIFFPKAAAGEKTLTSVRAAALSGWTTTVARDPATAAPTSVTWTALAGTSIGADQFGQFSITAGPLPTTDTLSFPAEQTYSDGSVVKWNEQPKADGSEPEHPVPTLMLAAAGTSASPAPTASTAAPVNTHTTDSTARWLGGVGLLLGALGLSVGGAAGLRNRGHRQAGGKA